jgi:hypothetical protein
MEYLSFQHYILYKFTVSDMKQLFYFSAVMYCMSCSAPVKEHSTHTLLHHINIRLNEEFIGNGGAFIAYDDGITGIEESGSMPPFFSLSAKEKMHTYIHFGNRGQGPEEFIHPSLIQYLDKNVFGAYDLVTKTYGEVAIPRNTSSVRTFARTVLSSHPFAAIKTAYGQYVGLSTKEGLLVLMDSAGREIAPFFEYPCRNEDERAVKNYLRAMAYQGTLVASPQKTKCVYAALDGEIIHFYSIRKDSIILIDKIEKTYPRYKPEDNGMSYSSMMDWGNTVGYISLAVTDRFIYALYCGKTYEELKKETGSIMLTGNQLRIFDWTGRMVRTCTLDVSCRYIGATNDDSRLWAMACLPEITPVCFDLNETPSNDTRLETPSAVKDGNSAEKTLLFNPADNQQDRTAATSVMKNDSRRINQLNMGKIKPGEVRKYTFHLQTRVTSLRATSDDIILRDSTVLSNQSWIFVSLTKQRTGEFNDTIYISSDADKMILVITGEVVK